MTGVVSADAWVAQAMQHLANARYGDAERCLREALALQPKHAEALHRLGVIALTAGHARDAEQLIAQALDEHPANAAAHVNLGIALNAQRRYGAAVDSYRRALDIDPALESAYLNQAAPLQALGRIDDAVAVLEQALALNGERAEALNNLGNLYKEQGRLADALASYDRALAANPLMQEAFSNKLAALKLCTDRGAEEIFAEHRRWSAWFEAVRADYEPLANSPDPERRLKLGYVSPDGHTALPAFLRPVWREHDRERFEIHAYYNNPQPEPASTDGEARVVRHVMAGRSDADVARQIRADGIDILIDIAGHTGKNRLGVFARRAAPIQVTWLDYLGTTGLDAMDYRITDAVADPPSVTEHVHSERLLRMPATQWCWEPPADAPAVCAPPILANGFATFGSFNNYSKLTDATLRLWRRLLERLPTARLLLAGVPEGKARERIIALLGAASERADFLPRVAESAYRAAIGHVDIALDPTPFSGATTTLDALWQGVPVLTCGGPFSWSRSSASLLQALRMDEWIAADEDDFLRRAADFAARGGELAQWRAGLRTVLSDSAITDARAFAANLERELRGAWARWCKQRGARDETRSPSPSPSPSQAPSLANADFDASFERLRILNADGSGDASDTALQLALALHDARPSCKMLHAELAKAALGWARGALSASAGTLLTAGDAGLHTAREAATPFAQHPVPRSRISFVICSIQPDRFDAVTARIRALFAAHDIEIVGIHDARSLCEGYNRGAGRAKGDILVFCHDDIDFVDADCAERLLKALSAADLIGVAGASKLVSGNWEHAGPPYLHGHIVHQRPGDSAPVYYVSGMQQATIAGVQALDGVFMACRRAVWEGLRFDADTFDGFHLYDVDFSYRAHLAGFNVAVATDLLLVHHSLGKYDPAWQRFNQRFLEKFPALTGVPTADRACSLNVKLRDLDQVQLLRHALAHWRFGLPRDAVRGVNQAEPGGVDRARPGEVDQA